MPDNEKSAGLMLPPYVPGSRPFVPGETVVPYSGPWWGEEEIDTAVECLRSGSWLAAGENVAAFERAFSLRLGCGFSAMINSGSSADLLMLLAAKERFGWRDGDRVVVSACSFPTTVASICQAGFMPEFVDPSLDDLNPTSQAIADRASAASAVAVLLAPTLGNPPDMEAISADCRSKQNHPVMLLLDNCDGLRSKWNGVMLGNYATASTCSFYASHHLCTGEGGMVSSHSESIVESVRRLANWGRDCTCNGRQMLAYQGDCGRRFSHWLRPAWSGVTDHRYVYGAMGYNLKPLDLQGAIGLVQLGKLDEAIRLRCRNKRRLGAAFERLEGVRVVSEWPGAEASWFGVPVVCESLSLRDRLVSRLERHKIQTRPCFAGNILLHPGFRHLGNAAEFPNATAILERVFFVGCAPFYTEAMLAYVEEVVAGFVV